MTEKGLYLKANVKLAETILSLIRKNISLDMFTLNRGLKLLTEENNIFIPVVSEVEESSSSPSIYLNKLKNKIIQLEPDKAHMAKEIELKQRRLMENDFYAKKPRDLHHALESKLPKDILAYIPKSFDIIGDIIITEIDRWGDLEEHLMKKYQSKDLNAEIIKNIVGDTILELNKGTKVVLNKMSKISGEFRTRKFEHIAGEIRTTTLYKENGFEFELDIDSVFFTPRLVFERERVSNLELSKGSVVLDCFAGIGPYSIQIAGKNEVLVLACEKNHFAFNYLSRNLKLNKDKMTGSVKPYLGDFRDFSSTEIADPALSKTSLIIMNLPKRNLEFLPDLYPYIRPEGTLLVIYLFAPEPDPIDHALKMLHDKLEGTSISIAKREFSRVVKNYAPKVYTVALQVVIKKK